MRMPHSHEQLEFNTNFIGVRLASRQHGPLDRPGFCHAGVNYSTSRIKISGVLRWFKFPWGSKKSLIDNEAAGLVNKTNLKNRIGGEKLEGCDWCVLIPRINDSSPNLHFVTV
jgi:hypothetical protein